MPLWKPPVVDNLHMWLRADSLDYLAGNVNVTLWSDESGNGRDVSEDASTPNNPPGLVQHTQNGLSVVEFSKARTECLFGGADYTEFGEDPFLMTAVFKTATSTGSAETVFGDNADNDLFEFRYTNDSDRPIKYFGSGADADSPLIDVGTNMSMVTYTRVEDVSSGGDAKYYVNGKLEGSETETADYTDTDATTGLFIVGASNTKASPQKPLNGQICEIIMYSAHLSDADRFKLEGYLSHKWGIESTLLGSGGSADHTYQVERSTDGITLLGETLGNETLDRSLEGDLSTVLNMVDSDHGGWSM